MRTLLLLLACLACLVSPLAADTIYQASAQGKQVVVQREAIVVSEDPSFLVYKHFDLKDRRVEIVRLNQGSLPYRAVPSSPQERQQIVDIWKRFGYKATVTDVAGKPLSCSTSTWIFTLPAGAARCSNRFPLQRALPCSWIMAARMTSICPK